MGSLAYLFRLLVLAQGSSQAGHNQLPPSTPGTVTIADHVLLNLGMLTENLELQGNLAVRSCGGEQWFSEAPNSLSCGSVFSFSTPLLNYRGLLQEGRVLKLQRKTYYCGDKKVPQLLIEHHVFSGSFRRKSTWEIPRIERLELGESYQQLKIRLHNSKSEGIFSCVCCYLHGLSKHEPVSSLLCFRWVHVMCLWTSSAGRVKYICLWDGRSTEHHNISDQEMKTEEFIKCIFRVNSKQAKVKYSAGM